MSRKSIVSAIIVCILIFVVFFAIVANRQSVKSVDFRKQKVDFFPSRSTEKAESSTERPVRKDSRVKAVLPEISRNKPETTVETKGNNSPAQSAGRDAKVIYNGETRNEPDTK
jgi:hypothetical protein